MSVLDYNSHSYTHNIIIDYQKWVGSEAEFRQQYGFDIQHLTPFGSSLENIVVDEKHGIASISIYFAFKKHTTEPDIKKFVELHFEHLIKDLVLLEIKVESLNNSQSDSGDSDSSN